MSKSQEKESQTGAVNIRQRQSLTMVPDALIDSSEIGFDEKIVYVVLARFADKSGAMFPSLKTIAARSGLYPQAIQAAIKKLSDTGWLLSDGGQFSLQWEPISGGMFSDGGAQ